MLAIPEFTTAQFARRPPGSPGASRLAAEAAIGIRVVSPPRRQTGIWLILQAAPNQGRQPFLPQIPKSYLRIKDEGLTISLLMKYLVKKLGLEDESEVEITCRDQQLLPFLTLQYVRDNIWSASGENMTPYEVKFPATYKETQERGYVSFCPC
ncbi:hypothetical protein OPV22_019699 [Ensete ventricosum]|uniref:Uncharacterized protein n=1 Tax=Ensete ventricosum TaxID=4639 RepID=A0AAV8QLK3_ENSVE|nr:hypothetical protein OPV22_019699 [Ensete ventricosum]